MANKSKLNRAARRQQKRQEKSAAPSHARSASQPHKPAQSPSHRSLAASHKRLEQFDDFSALRNGLRKIAHARGDWAGIPMPLTGERLIIEPTYPKAKELMSFGLPDNEVNEDEGCVEVNTWYSKQWRADIVIFKNADGKLDWGRLPAFHSLGFVLSTLNCSEAWGIEQESNATALLATMLSHRQFKQYMLTGTFLESSKRSGVFYLFRRLRPTVAIVADSQLKTRILCALCMHPIAYYAKSWAGAMTPTDDVVAHLSLMRGDEAMFWRRSTQHPAWRPEAGL